MVERLAALAILFAAGAYLFAALGMPRGVAARPGPGFFPLSVGMFLSLAAAAFVLETIRRPTGASAVGRSLPRDARLRVVATAAALVVFVLLLPWIGYPLATALFVGGLLRALGGTWVGSLIAAVLAAAVSYYGFAVLLSVPLPRGVFFE
jgi:putative tricarboxylic transport membrane protein